MALRTILHHPDERLHIIAQPVVQIDDTIRTLVDDMAETMYDARGIGLAATQINVHQRVIVIDISESRDQLQVFINPVIVGQEGQTVYEEGCLSIPGIYDKVTRAEKVTVETLGLDGQKRTVHADGLLAICIQHEIDHLDGKLFVEYLSRLKQDRIRKKLCKQEKA